MFILIIIIIIIIIIIAAIATTEAAATTTLMRVRPYKCCTRASISWFLTRDAGTSGESRWAPTTGCRQGMGARGMGVGYTRPETCSVSPRRSFSHWGN